MYLDLIALDDSARVWIYQAATQLSEYQVENIRKDLLVFLDQWTSHNRNLYTYGNIFHHRFLVLFVDETFADASGCSIDKSVHFIQSLEDKYGVSLMERRDVAVMEKALDEEGEDISNIYTISLDTLKEAYESGKINEETLIFDNLVKTKSDFLKKWVVPVKSSWHKRFI